MIRPTEQSLNRLLISTLLLWVGGCSRPVAEPQMPVDVPDAFSITGTELLSKQWWRAFEDDELDALIDKALTDNFDLRTAWDRLAQAQALARKTDASLWPQADLVAGARRSRQETGGRIVYSSLYSVGLAASYEADVGGFKSLPAPRSRWPVLVSIVPAESSPPRL